MSFLSKLRQEVNYRKNPPACRSCEYYVRPKIALTKDSVTIAVPSSCKLHTFVVKPDAVCNTWEKKRVEQV
jgi:hypothetical protein